MSNPFGYNRPVDGDQFTGRSVELHDVLGRIRDHVNVAVIAPRRYGKTSLINEVCARALADGAGVARVDAMLANEDAALFASRLVTAVYRAAGPWHRTKDALSAYAAAFAHLQPSITLGTDGPTFGFTTKVVEQNPTAVLEGAYGLLARATSPVLVVDEFQELVKFDGNLPGVFKGLADAHPDVSLVIAGSREHMMRDLTEDSRGPLYGMMHLLHLPAVSAVEMGDYVERRFNWGGKPAGRMLADRITALAGPVPNDIQHLAYDIYAAVQTSRELTDADVDAGMAAAVTHVGGGFVDTFAVLTGGQRRVLIALAQEPSVPPQSAGFVARTGYANPSGVARALAALEKLDVVALRDGTWTVVDPFLRAWLRDAAT